MVDRAGRPGGLEFRSNSFDTSASNMSLGDLPSPRAGEVPPALSPLDALALQGKLLAKRFEEQDRKGRRISRLAPLTIQNEFGNRPGYFRSLSNSTVNSPEDEHPRHSPPLQASPREFKSQDRHKSFYPQLQSDDFAPPMPMAFRNNLPPVAEAMPPAPADDYFGRMPRSRSPDPVEPRMNLQEATPISPSMPRSKSATRQQPFRNTQKKPSADSLSVKRQPSQPGLLPPRSPSSLRSPRMSPTVRSVPGDGSDVDDMSLGASYESLRQRQLSPTSSLSRSHSPLSPPLTNSSVNRSPSLSSEFSAGGSQLPRPAFNFSRPLSSASRDAPRPSADYPSRQASDESAMMRPSLDRYERSFDGLQRQDSYDMPTPNYSNDVVHTPVSMTSEDFRRSSDSHHNAPAPSYTYSKYNLPRGRKLDRHSIGIEEFFNKQITWDSPSQGARPVSPPSPPRSIDRPRTRDEAAPSTRSGSTERGAPSLTSSNSTIRARPYGSSEEITPQGHCDMGIQFHEEGNFTKSTYHFRLAARAGLPEAMFWYGLACRHGWGMRENKAEALQWLRKAVDSGQLEVADDEVEQRQGKQTDLVKRKKHRAQYAIAIYELGKCYMNGWGTSPDKGLALRCYEIAGNWGDADALAEAGYCYAEGQGCKKDLKKAAKLYRAAEAKGISMIGNSWIYKDKYMDDATSTSDARSVRSGRSVKKDNSEKKPRDKSRTRTIFGRKKSFANVAP